MMNYKRFRADYDYLDPNYAFYYKFIKRPISYPLAWIVYSKTRFTPNQLSFMGLVSVILSAFFFALGGWVYAILGGLLFFLFEVFDDFDGIIARSKKLGSKRGGWFDSVLGVFGKIIITLAISLGVFRVTSDPSYLVLGLIGIAAYGTLNSLDENVKIHFFKQEFRKLRFAEHKPDPATFGGQLSILSEIILNAWFTVLLVSSLTNQLGFFLYFTAAYYSLYALTQFLYRSYQYRNY